MYRADKILLCTGWCYVQREVGVVTVVVSPSARSDAGGRVVAGRKMGRLRRRLDSALHLNMKYKLSLVLRRAAARARKETVYHYAKEPQTCALAS